MVRFAALVARALVVLAAVGCASTPSSTISSATAPSPARVARVVALDSFGPLFTTMVNVAGKPRRFLVDTGGGMTVFSPELATESGCLLGPQLTGFRMSGERIDAPRCEGAAVDINGWTSPPHTALVIDLGAMLPPDWPRLDGLLSLATFDGTVITVDLPAHRLIVDDVVPHGARPLRARFERSVAGLALGAFIASRHGGRDYWLELDTGSNDAVLLNEPVAAAIGLPTQSGAVASLALHVDDGAPIVTNAKTDKLRFDGNAGLATMAQWAITFDLANERVWIRTP